MIGRSPHEIWEQALDDGEERLARRNSVVAATSLLGGFHVMLGLLALVVATGALGEVMPIETAHVLGSLTFGFGLAFITVGRSELFTENFLVPVSTVLLGRGSVRALARLWTIALALNVVGMAALAGILSVGGVIESSATEAAGDLADTLIDRSLLAAFLSAILAGAVMTTFTWLAEASESDVTRVLIALLIGFVLLAPSTNHAVVGTGEILLGIFSGTSAAGFPDLLGNLAVATAGNLVGGIGLVTFTRLEQAGGEPAA
ncbi:MAG: formate/nitrite transporter family protein [Solirubrobacterales bacterium]|nr:formate/nitrite transporter family protein [Solirubrobacterales bacterium]